MQLVEGGVLSTLEHGHDVAVKSFCLDEEEVTVARFRAAVEHGDVTRDCKREADCPAVPKLTAWDGDGTVGGQGSEDRTVSRFCNGQREGVDDHPVNCVSFAEAEGFCKSRSARLPRGDEWEWAAHGRRTTPWGTPIATDEPCWGRPHKRAGTCPVRSHPKDRTDEGIWDLGGDVSEWVTPPARAGASPARWAYGASWYAIDDGYVRAALGGVEMPAKRAEIVGFRCAADRAP